MELILYRHLINAVTFAVMYETSNSLRCSQNQNLKNAKILDSPGKYMNRHILCSSMALICIQDNMRVSSSKQIHANKKSRSASNSPFFQQHPTFAFMFFSIDINFFVMLLPIGQCCFALLLCVQHSFKVSQRWSRAR